MDVKRLSVSQLIKHLMQIHAQFGDIPVEIYVSEGANYCPTGVSVVNLPYWAHKDKEYLTFVRIWTCPCVNSEKAIAEQELNKQPSGETIEVNGCEECGREPNITLFGTLWVSLNELFKSASCRLKSKISIKEKANEGGEV